jgi:hypothetical protein
MLVRPAFLALVVGSVFIVGCTQTPSPTSPSPALTGATALPASSVAAPVSAIGAPAAAGVGRKPEYEHAYYNGTIVTMNHIDVPVNPGPLAHAAADLYAVIYPANHSLWPVLPLCNPCVHNGNPIYHDHVLDSIPSDPGHGEFNPLWHVFVIRPANPSPAAQAAYAARLPMTSESAVDAAIEDGVAQEIDTGSYFLCSIVDDHAGR